MCIDVHVLAEENGVGQLTESGQTFFDQFKFKNPKLLRTKGTDSNLSGYFLDETTDSNSSDAMNDRLPPLIPEQMVQETEDSVVCDVQQNDDEKKKDEDIETVEAIDESKRMKEIDQSSGQLADDEGE